MPRRSTIASQTRRRAKTAATPVPALTHTLLVIDNRPLQREAWAEFHTARKRMEKASRDLHRHEEIDRPAYESWLHRTFPVFVTTLRELLHEVTTKSRQVQTVIALSEMTGRSVKKLWREQKEREANPEAFEHPGADDDGFFEPEDEPASRTRSSARKSFGADRSEKPTTTVKRQAREIYRRLVQRLHPDRGGRWTATRERLWHQVQQAWAEGDADWLARIEVEWETANEILGPTSPLSRLRRAIEELHAARRDTERKLRDYRGSPQWRFTVLGAGKKKAILHESTEANFVHDIDVLRRQLAYLDATIGAWEKTAASEGYSAGETRRYARRTVF